MGKKKSNQQKKLIQERQKRNRERKAENLKTILFRDFSGMWAYPAWERVKFEKAVDVMEQIIGKLNRRELLNRRF